MIESTVHFPPSPSPLPKLHFLLAHFFASLQFHIFSNKSKLLTEQKKNQSYFFLYLSCFTLIYFVVLYSYFFFHASISFPKLMYLLENGVLDVDLEINLIFKACI